MDERSKYLRRLCLRAFRPSRRGHIGSSFSCIEILRVLYDSVARHDVTNPEWTDRDRIILSKGHGCVAQYALLADKGYFPTEELDRFCMPDGILGGHPSHKVPGIECSTGALGHGLSIGVGMALSAERKGRNRRVFVIMGDGELQEGSVWEAAMCAAKHGLDNLVVIVDNNKIQSAGLVEEVQPMGDLIMKWKSFGFEVRQCNGHNIAGLKSCLSDLPIYRKPKCIIAHTIKGKGISFAENNPEWHHKSGISDKIFEQMENELSPSSDYSCKYCGYNKTDENGKIAWHPHNGFVCAGSA